MFERYTSPKSLIGLVQDIVPDGDFLLPVCTNKERFLLMLQALMYYRSVTENHNNLDHMIDVLEAMAYINDPHRSPCFPDPEARDETVCVDYLPNAGIISYAPGDPFNQPDYTPPGYTGPPFTVINNDIIEGLFGLQDGDVVTGIFGAPVFTPAIGQGLARLRVAVKGKATVELHLLTLPFGGSALITLDGNPLSTVVVELIRNTALIPPEDNVVLIYEVETFTEGDHVVDVSFIPSFGGVATFIGYGGGLRKVNICTEKSAESHGDFELSNCTFESGDNMRLRKKPGDPCILQIECGTDEWEDWYDPRSCMSDAINEQVRQPEAQGELESGECREFKNIVLRGNDRWHAPIKVEEGFVIEVHNAAGGWAVANNEWYCPSGQMYALGGCTSMGANAGSGFPVPDKPKGRLIATYGALAFDAFNARFVIPAGAPQAELMFQMNDTDLSNNDGSVSFEVKICRAEEAESWYVDFDLTAEDHGWSAFPAPYGDGAFRGAGEYQTGQGWKAALATRADGLYHDICVRIKKTFTATTVTNVIMHYSNDFIAGRAWKSGMDKLGDTMFLQVSEAEGADLTLNIPIGGSTDQLCAWVCPASSRFDGDIPAGSGAIKRIEVFGTGPKPPEFP